MHNPHCQIDAIEDANQADHVALTAQIEMVIKDMREGSLLDEVEEALREECSREFAFLLATIWKYVERGDTTLIETVSHAIRSKVQPLVDERAKEIAIRQIQGLGDVA